MTCVRISVRSRETEGKSFRKLAKRIGAILRMNRAHVTRVSRLMLLELLAAAALAFHDPAPPSARPIILLVHGRGQLGRDTSALRRELQRSLEAGLNLPVTDSLFQDGDVRLVWYADVLDPRSEEGCQYHEANPRSRERWERRGGSQEFWNAARGFLGFAASAVDSVNGDAARALLGDLLFAGDLWKRCGAEERVATALGHAAREGRPVILVSHSFGALVTYGYLEGYRAPPGTSAPDVRRWITLGSMLGVPAVRQLMLGEGGTSLPRPSVVQRWLNLRDLDDPLSSRAAEEGVESNAVELETGVRGGSLAHELPTYLRDPPSARAIAYGWCNAFPRRGAAPEWCALVSDATSALPSPR